MADDQEDQNLYEQEQGATSDKGEDSATQPETGRLNEAADRAGRADTVGSGVKPKGIRGRFRTRRSRMVLATAGAGGLSGMIMGGFLFLGPTFGLTDMVKNIADFEFGPTENIRARRQVRLMYDFVRNGRDGVLEGRRIGSYNTRLENRWRDFNMGRFAEKARAAGWTIEFDPDLVDLEGNRVNTAGNATPEFDDAGNCTNCRNRAPTRIVSPRGDLSLDLASGGTLDNLSQAELRSVMRPMLREVYPGVIIGAAKRTHVRGFANAAVGFRWGKFFSEGSTNAISRAYNSIFNPSSSQLDSDARATTDGGPIERDADGNCTNCIDGLEIDGEPVEVDTQPINERKATALALIREGASPRTVFRSLSSSLFGSIRSALTTSSVLIGLASLACVAQSLFEGDVEAKYNRYSSLMAFGGLMLGIADEIKNGGFVSPEELGELYNEFIAFERIVVDDAGNWVEVVKSIGDSATIQRANGNALIDGEELAPENYLDVDQNAAYEIFANIGSLVDSIPGSSAVCGFLNSTIGGIFSFVVGIGECFFSGGFGCAAGEVATELLFMQFGDAIFRSVFGLSLGNDLGIIPGEPPQTAEVFAHAASLYDSEGSRSGLPISEDQYRERVVAYLNDRQEEINDLPFFERYFAVSTPGSLGQDLALWRGEAQYKSVFENVGSLFTAPFKSLGSLFATPARAQQDRTCLSESNFEYLEEENEGVECLPANLSKGLQKYSYDAVIQCNGRNINLLEGVDIDNFNLDDPNNPGNNYGMNWVEEQVLLIMQDGSAGGATVECPQFSGQGELARRVAEVCHGLIFADNSAPRIDLNAKHAYYNDPARYGNSGAQNRNEDVRRYCHFDKEGDGVDNLLDDDIDYRQMYALIGRYVDDIIQTDGMVFAGGGFEE